jgi:hypothetical protein
VGRCNTLAGFDGIGVSVLFAIILRIRAFPGASWSAH